MNRQQPDRLAADRSRCLGAAGLERAHKTIRRGVTPAVEGQRHTEQRAQIRQHRAALRRRGRRAKTRQHIAVVVNALEGIVRRQAVQPALPLGQNRPQPFQGGRKQLLFL